MSKKSQSKSIRNINIHLINSSERNNFVKRSRKSSSLSALDQVHIVITNIDLNGGSANPTKKILHDKIYTLLNNQSGKERESKQVEFQVNRRPRRFSQLKTRKSHLLETNPSNIRTNRSYSNVSNIYGENFTNSISEANFKSIRLSRNFDSFYLNNTGKEETKSRLKLSQIDKPQSVNMSQRKHHTHEHHHYHHSNSNSNLVARLPREKNEMTKKKTNKRDSLSIPANNVIHVNNNRDDDPLSDNFSSSSMSINSQINGHDYSSRLSLKNNLNGRNVFNNLYNQGQ